jgi:uncharacterized protein (DUF488 family)
VKNVNYLNYLGSMITYDVICRRDIKSKIVVAKAAFTEMRTPFTSQEDLQLRKKVVKRYVWSSVLYGAETWTLRKVHHKHL